MMINKLSYFIIISILFVGCGEDYDNNESVDKLEARFIQEDNEFSKHYFGKCIYKDNSAEAILIEVNNPIEDKYISVSYIDGADLNPVIQNRKKIIFMAKNTKGSIKYIEHNLNFDSLWNFHISSNNLYYIGTIRGSFFECKLKVVLNAKTDDDIDNTIHRNN